MTTVDYQTGLLHGNAVQSVDKRLGDLQGYFLDAEAFRRMDASQLVYQVQYFLPVKEGSEGGLFWGNTTIQPGKVGDEFFMTKGHFHAIRNRGEYYSTVQGTGALLLMDEAGTTRIEQMQPGSLHYIPGCTGHRVANTGDVALTFLACWPSDAGHDYKTIEREGFSGRMLDVHGHPRLVTMPRA